FYNLTSAKIPVFWLVLFNLVLFIILYWIMQFVIAKRLAITRMSAAAYSQAVKIKSSLQQRMETMRRETDKEFAKVDRSDEEEMLRQKLDAEIKATEKKIDQTIDQFHAHQDKKDDK